MKTARLLQASRIRSAPFAIFVATRAEMRPIARALQSACQSSHQSNSMIRIGAENRDLLLVRTGVGLDRAEAAARRLFEETPVAAALSFGVAGGLSPQAQTGDLIVGDRVILRCGSRQANFPCDTGLQEAVMTVIRRVSSRYHRGPILTVDRIMRNAEEKHRLATESGAMVVDMESAAIASAAAARSVPFLAIRGILDPVHEDLAVSFDQFLDTEGEPHLPRLMRYLLAHPFTLPYLLGLGRRTKAVCMRLGLLLRELSNTMN